MDDEAADYGFDAPHVPVLMAAGALLAVPLGLIEWGSGIGFFWLALGLLFAGQAWIYVHTTRKGKFVAWTRILDRLELQGDEQVLDMGCGLGAVLTAVAKRLPEGRVTGVDLWRKVDQSGNAVEETIANVKAEGVPERVDLFTANMTNMPFPDGHFDVVVSSLAIHNIKSKEGRRAAIDQAVRVLRPGGRLVIADIQATKIYVQRLTELGMLDVRRRSLGPDFWYGGPWMATSLVTATKPEPDSPIE